MLFNSVSFLIFFPIAVIVYYLVPQRVRQIWLLLCSYFFYMCWNAGYALLLLASTLVTYAGGLVIAGSESTAKRKTVLVCGITINLGMLFVFKYLGFFGEIFSLDVPSILLPVGISFYIFQALGYLIDVYRNDTKAERNFLTYALFVSFFPQLVAGPIERSGHLLSQIKEYHPFETKNIYTGAIQMLWGYFIKLVIAERCAMIVTTVYGNYTEEYGYRIFLAAVCFTLQIYGDFMGYSMIAKGAARMLGIDLMDNFRQPYFAGSIREHWQRWHISLSTWFRDYLYIPLGGSRCSRIKKYRNIMITFLVSGLWHGAAWKYVVWGGLHGLLQIIEDLLKPAVDRFVKKFNIDRSNFSWRFLAVAKTYLLLTIVFVVFRADDLSQAMFLIKKMFVLKDLRVFLVWGFSSVGLDYKNMAVLAIAVIIMIAVSVLREKHGTALAWLNKQNIVFRYMVYWVLLVTVVFSLDFDGTPFIYFQF